MSLRKRLLLFLFVLMMVSLLGALGSFWTTRQLTAQLEDTNQRLLPFQKDLLRLQNDTVLFEKEVERNLGWSRVSDPRWRPRAVPSWVLELQKASLAKLSDSKLPSDPDSRRVWLSWKERLLSAHQEWFSLIQKTTQQNEALLNSDSAIVESFSRMFQLKDQIQRDLTWAKQNLETEVSQSFILASSAVDRVRYSLQIMVISVILTALVMMWLGERTLRPVEEIRSQIQRVLNRGKMSLEESSDFQVRVHQQDEVGEMAREFHRMATSLIEREKTIEYQKDRLEEQNRLLLQVSELKEKLQQAEQLASVGRMSAQVAHEVGNPLQSIGLEAELGLELLNENSEKNKPQIKQSFQSILHAVERLKVTLQNYLKLSKLTPGHAELFDLCESLERVLALYSNSFQSQKVQVNWIFDVDSKAFVLGDVQLFEYAVGNIIRNSIQALEEKDLDRKFFMKIEKRHSDFHIHFFDNGPGVSEDIRNNLFKPFLTTKVQGTGLGLSFVRKVFTDMGGSFDLAYSDSKQGTEFLGVIPSLETETGLAPPNYAHQSTGVKEQEIV